MKGKKTGGRVKGSLNKVRGLTGRRERVRKQAARTIQQAMPRLQQWLSSDQAWQGDNAPQSARMLDSLMKWILPAYGRLDPHAEQQAEQQAAAEQPATVSAEQVLEAFRSTLALPSSPSPEAPALEQELERLSAEDSERERHAGIPIPGTPGAALLPKAPATQATARPDPAALAATDRPTIDARPVRETRSPADFNANGLIQNPVPLDPSLRPMGWR